jgi:predicted O-methyltransferase YrrM
LRPFRRRSPDACPRLEWSDHRFRLDGTSFRILHGTSFEVGAGPELEAEAGELALWKPRWMVERYLRLTERLNPERIFELGVMSGGSVAFLAQVAQPQRHVAIDLRPASTEAFEAWLDARDRRQVVHLHYGVDQADQVALEAIVAHEFGRQKLDLVVDDASHVLEPTRASFNALFPHLRAGGVYVIEDWNQDHDYELLMIEDPTLAERVRREVARRPDKAFPTPLTRLLFEIVLATAYTDLIDDIEIRKGWVAVTRGSGQSDPEGFDISQCHLGLGRALLGDPAN